MFTLGTLFEAALLLINSIAILNEERFLKKGNRKCTFSQKGNRPMFAIIFKHNILLMSVE